MTENTDQNGSAESTATAYDFEQHTVDQLRTFMRQAGLTPGTKLKPDLINALVEAGFDPDAKLEEPEIVKESDLEEPTAEDNELADAKLRIAELEAEREEAERVASLQKTANEPGTREAASMEKDFARPHRLWASKDCPQNAPTVCGIDFPKWTDPPAVEEDGTIVRDGDDVRRQYQKGHVVMLTQAKIKAITDKLAEPVRVDDEGRLISGKVVLGVGTDNGEAVPLGPLGKWLHIEPIREGEAISSPNLDELRSIESQLNALYRRSREEERAEEPDKRLLKQFDDQIDQLEQRLRTLAGV